VLSTMTDPHAHNKRKKGKPKIRRRMAVRNETGPIPMIFPNRSRVDGGGEA